MTQPSMDTVYAYGTNEARARIALFALRYSTVRTLPRKRGMRSGPGGWARSGEAVVPPQGMMDASDICRRMYSQVQC